MNGRVYDPVLARFLSADPYVQDAGDTQALNRYSYAHNNPLSYTDPSGFFFKKIAKFFKSIVKGIVQLVSNPRALLGIAIAALAPELAPLLGEFGAAVLGGALSGAITGGDIQSALHGAITAGLFHGVGLATQGMIGATGSDLFSGAFNVAGHAAIGCASAVAQGGRCSSGALSAGFVSFAGPLIPEQWGFGGRLAATATIGGTASVVGGGKFANGAATGAFAYIAMSTAAALVEGGRAGNENGRSLAATSAGGRGLTPGEVALAEANVPNAGTAVDWSNVTFSPCHCTRSYTFATTVYLDDHLILIPDFSGEVLGLLEKGLGCTLA